MSYFMDYYVILVKYLFTDQFRAKMNTVVSKKGGNFNIMSVLQKTQTIYFRKLNV